MAYLLAGDIGGTKTDLAIYTLKAGPTQPVMTVTVRSAEYNGLEEAAAEFLASTDITVQAAAFGVAGPVVEGRAEGTNLPWSLDEARLRDALGIEQVTLLNDLQAIANSVPHLTGDDLRTLNEGIPQPQGALAVVAPGTGLGEAFLTWENGHYRAHPSEAGHSSFSPNSEQEIALLRYLRPRFGHVSVERVCSGRWIVNLFDFLRDERYAPVPKWLEDQLAEASDPTPVLVSAGLDAEGSCEICRMMVKLFMNILAAEAGNMALTVMATGGVYLGGGMSQHLLPAFEHETFMASFSAKGRLKYILDEVPVHVILHPQAGLLGAAAYGLDHMTD